MGKHYQNRLQPHHEQLIITQLREEWANAEKGAKKHELVQRAKTAGVHVGQTILGLALAAGVLTIALAAPGFAVAIKAFDNTRGPRRYFSTNRLPAQLRRGSANKYWHYTKTGENTYRISLTPHGRQIALGNALRNFKLSVQPTWDGIWRVVTFDIPKKYSNWRDALRRKLIEIGMHPLQESVFIYPYPCTDEVMMWVELFGVRDGVEMLESRFITADRAAELADIFKVSFKKTKMG